MAKANMAIQQHPDDDPGSTTTPPFWLGDSDLRAHTQLRSGALLSLASSPPSPWQPPIVIDSEASHHMFNCTTLFLTLSTLPHPTPIRLGDGKIVTSTQGWPARAPTGSSLICSIRSKLQSLSPIHLLPRPVWPPCNLCKQDMHSRSNSK